MRLRRYRCEVVGCRDFNLLAVFVYAVDLYDAEEKALERCGDYKARVYPRLDN